MFLLFLLHIGLICQVLCQMDVISEWLFFESVIDLTKAKQNVNLYVYRSISAREIGASRLATTRHGAKGCQPDALKLPC